jgi:hypothetical protein
MFCKLACESALMNMCTGFCAAVLHTSLLGVFCACHGMSRPYCSLAFRQCVTTAGHASQPQFVIQNVASTM